MHNLFLIALLVIRLHPMGSLVSDKLENLYAQKYLQPQSNTIVQNTETYKEPKKVDNETTEFPSSAYYSIDLKTNQSLLNKNIDQKLPIASLTKLMTAYLVLSDLNLDQNITITTQYMHPDDATAYLAHGEVLPVKSALEAMLINSSSEAAASLAIADSGSIENFVSKMNSTAEMLGLSNTSYANPVGWDDEKNYSSARDITNLSRILLRHKTFTETVSKKTAQIQTQSGRVVNLESTNQLLGNNGFIGVKTGFTFVAGECLVSLNANNEKEILTTVIGSGNRFGETTQIINWIYTHYLW